MRNVKAFMVAFLLLASAGVSYAATGAYLEPLSSQHYMQVADARDVVHDEYSGTVVRSSSGECVRTKWMNNTDECAGEVAVTPPIQREIHRAASLSREERTVYFAFNQASIAPEMKERLNSLAQVLRTDTQVRGARIVGYADRIGNPKYNEKLSKRRAENVRQYLVAHGIINTSVADTRWVGASEPSADCPNDMKRSDLINCLQTDRKVEVEIDFTPDQNASR